MIYGVGIDLVEIKRICQVLIRSPQFINKILTKSEIEFCSCFNTTRQNEFIAGRFAVKEAFAKAIKTGIGRSFSFQDLSVLPDSQGAPNCEFSPKFTKIIAKNNWQINISITHTKDLAQAIVIVDVLN